MSPISTNIYKKKLMAKSVETLALSQVMQNMTGLSLFPIATIYCTMVPFQQAPPYQSIL